MASRFTSVTQEQILSINEVAVPKYTKMATKFAFTLLCLTSFDHLTYLVTLHVCAQKCITQRDFPFLLCAFIEVLLEIHQILERLIIQLVCNKLKQLFTSVSVKVVDINFTYTLVINS